MELSGLGNRKLLGAKSLPDRYKNLCEVAKTRSVLSLGLSCFKLQRVRPAGLSQHVSHTQGQGDCSPDSNSKPQVKQWTYSVQTFNIVLLCSEDYMVEPGALKFLVEHGFDFNKQYTVGVSYYRGKEKTGDTKKSQTGPSARQVFDILLWSEVPIVVHNGFLDLMFLYQNLYTDLPPSLQVFLADVTEMFPKGILDTKYAVEFVDRLPATYLEYVFRKWQRKNAFQADIERRQVCLNFDGQLLSSPNVINSHCGLPPTCVEMDFIPKASVLQELVCICFANHGWCNSGKQCAKSHAIDLILDLDGIKAAKSRKRRQRKRDNQDQSMEEDLELGSPPPKNTLCLEHVAMKDSQLTEDQRDLSSAENVVCNSPEDSTIQQEKNSHDDECEITDAYIKSSLLLEQGRSGGHRAGFDAFMTGFVMACLLSKLASVDDSAERVMGAGIKLSQLSKVESLLNKIYATGKDQPMTVTKSSFCNPSKNHRDRIQGIRKS